MINTTASCGRFADHTYFQGRRENSVVLRSAERYQKESTENVYGAVPIVHHTDCLANGHYKSHHSTNPIKSNR